MTISKHPAVFFLAMFATVAAVGCDSETPPRGDDTAAASDDTDDDGDDDDASDGDDGGGDDGRPVTHLAAPGGPAAGPTADVPLHPCGNAILDDGEQCDDGLANGDDRECTWTCTLNECELDEHGVCTHDTPAADVDLYPCARGLDHLQGCDLDVAQAQ